jgi:hypothetical protein
VNPQATNDEAHVTDEELQLLTWRFAAMIGVIAQSEAYADANEIASDRAQRRHLIVRNKHGDPVFDFDQCAVWMVGLSGEPLERCRKIVFAEWGDEDEQQHASLGALIDPESPHLFEDARALAQATISGHEAWEESARNLIAVAVMMEARRAGSN